MIDTGIPSDPETATRSDTEHVASLTQALRLSQLEVAAKDEIIAALRDTILMYQRRDQLAAAIDTADLQRLTHARNTPATVPG